MKSLMALMIKGEGVITKVINQNHFLTMIIFNRNVILLAKFISYLFTGALKDWWAKTTAEKYLERAQCIVEQYGNFTSKQVGMPINGINSQGENIADHGGLKESYGAYRKRTEILHIIRFNFL